MVRRLLTLVMLSMICRQTFGISCYLCDIGTSERGSVVPAANQNQKNCSSTDPEILKKFSMDCNSLPGQNKIDPNSDSRLTWCHMAMLYGDDKKTVLKMYRSCASPSVLGMTAAKPCITMPSTLSNNKTANVQYCGCGSGDNCNKYTIDASSGEQSNNVVSLDSPVTDDSATTSTTLAADSGNQVSVGLKAQCSRLLFCSCVVFLLQKVPLPVFWTL